MFPSVFAPHVLATAFTAVTVVGWTAVVGGALLVRRSRRIAIFLGVLLGIYALIARALAPSFAAVAPVYTWLHATVFLNFAFLLARPRMRPLVHRLLVSWPSAFFAGGTLLAWPWAIVAALGVTPWGAWIPYVLAGIGLLQSLTTKREAIDLLVLGPSGEQAPTLAPHPKGAPQKDARPLRIVQITDPHIGPFMSVARLRRIAERAVAAKPDLVVLTGDFLTVESHGDPDLLLDALAPLAVMKGRVFACFGNHDHEAPAIVVRALAAHGIALLNDDSRIVDTEAGQVQIVGMDFSFQNRRENMARVCAEHPRVPGATRIVLLHDPGAFAHLPPGEGDLVLSGHTHGGQVGLVSLGLSWTFLRLFGTRFPDHGFWARGTDRLYVHRGTGHYGFPLRLGVPAEESVLSVHRGTA